MSFEEILCAFFGHRFRRTWIIVEDDFMDANYCRTCGLVEPRTLNTVSWKSHTL
ncbi:MAG: hypothetical protein QW265_05860 [Candidatus Bathyarchaeia archaeon]